MRNGKHIIAITDKWFGGLLTIFNSNVIYLNDTNVWKHSFRIVNVIETTSEIQISLTNSLNEPVDRHLTMNLNFDLLDGEVIGASGRICMAKDYYLSDKECAFFYDNNIEITYYASIGIKLYNRKEIMRRWNIKNIIEHA